MNKFAEMIKIADIHADRLQLALSALKDVFPLTQDTVQHLTTDQLLYTELLCGRFSKLQDYLGRKIIDEYLKLTHDYADHLSMIDKLNKLERLGVLESVELWEKMREARNHIAHEYPDSPALTAKYLNQVFDYAPDLLKILKIFKHKGLA